MTPLVICRASCRPLFIGLLLAASSARGQAETAPAAPINLPEVTARATLVLQESGLWHDRARALKAILQDSEFRTRRQHCWGIGGKWRTGLSKQVGDQTSALRLFHQNLSAKLKTLQSGSDEERQEASQALESAAQAFEPLKTEQLALESEIFQPLSATRALVQELAADGFSRSWLDQAGREKASPEEREEALRRIDSCEQVLTLWQGKLLQVANPVYHPQLARRQDTVNRRIRHHLQREAALADVFASNNSGLPSLMTDSTGVAERLGGTSGLAASLFSAFGKDEEAVGTQAMATVRLPFRTPNESMTPPEGWSLFLRFQLPLERTVPETGGFVIPPTSNSRSRPSVQRYALTLGWDLSDQTDPRHLTPTRCFQAVEALTSVPVPLDDKSLKEVARRRNELSQPCVESAQGDLRVGLRFSGQWMEGRLRNEEGEPETKQGPSAVAIGLVVGQGNLTGQLTYRQSFEGRLLNPDRRVIDSVALAMSFGLDVGYATTERGHRARLGIDVSASFRELRGDNRDGAFEALIAPSVLFGLGGDAFGTVALGYLASPSRSGLLFTLGLTWDADRAMSPSVPAPSL